MSMCHRVLAISLTLIALISSCTPVAGRLNPASPVAMALPASASTPSPTVAIPSTSLAATLTSANSIALLPTQTGIPVQPPTATAFSTNPAATGESPLSDGLPLPTATLGPATRPAGPHTPLIALDPGHGGPDPGASDYGLVEKDVNLAIALKLAALLRDAGYNVILTRNSDRSVSPQFTGGGYPGTSLDLQARVDAANQAGADLFLSLHNNGSSNPDQSGTEVWYSSERSFSDRNVALARLVLAAIVERVHALGYSSVDRGIKEDTNFQIFRGRVYNLFVLGPGVGPRAHAATQMPGVLGESLFISNASDAAMLKQERTLDAIAAGYCDAVVAYFERFPQ